MRRSQHQDIGQIHLGFMRMLRKEASEYRKAGNPQAARIALGAARSHAATARLHFERAKKSRHKKTR